MGVTIRNMMEEEISKHNLDDVLRIYKEFDLAGIAVPLNEDEVMAQPQVQHNEIVQTIQDPNFGTILQARPPALFSATPQKIQGFAPLHGEHSEDVLSELGFTPDEIGRLAAEGVISTGGGLKSKL